MSHGSITPNRLALKTKCQCFESPKFNNSKQRFNITNRDKINQSN